MSVFAGSGARVDTLCTTGADGKLVLWNLGGLQLTASMNSLSV